MAEREEELKSLMMKVKEDRKKKLAENSAFKKLRSYGSITSWQVDGEKMETVAHFIFLGFKITPEGGCSHELKAEISLC